MPEPGDPQSRDDEPQNGSQEPERTSGISRVAGVSPEDERHILESAKENFDHISGKSAILLGKKFEIDPLEKDKTSEQRELINLILSKMKGFVEQYGGKYVDITENHIHILDPQKADSELQTALKEQKIPWANCAPSSQLIYMFDGGNILQLARGLVHETLHFESFNSIEPDPSTAGLRVRRAGVGIANYEKPDEVRIYFEFVLEAIIEELSKRFDERYFNDMPVLNEELNKRNKAREFFGKEFSKNGFKDADVSSMVNQMAAVVNDSGEEKIDFYAYREDRQRLNDIMADIQAKNSDQFKSAEDVFSFFANATMAGRLLPMARLIEKTYGKGFFRKLGEASKGIRAKGLK